MPPSLFLVSAPDADTTLRPHVHDGILRVTVMLKTTFSLIAGETSHWAGPEALIASDLPRRSNNLLSSPLRASDMALFKPMCDVLLVGALKAPRGWPATHLFGRLALARGDAPLLDKSVLAIGMDASGQARAVESAPLVWEEAPGGPKDGLNPIGSSRPSLRALGSDGSGCFAPIPQHWPSRSRLVDASTKDQLKLPSPTLSGVFTWEYFCAAPPDQRIAYLEGGERMLLQGMHADHPRLELTVPSSRACAWIAAKRGGKLAWLPNARARSTDGTAWTLLCDTLSIDVDMLTASLVYRVVVPIGPASSAPDELGVAIAITGAGGGAAEPRRPDDSDALFADQNRVHLQADLQVRHDRTLDMTTLDGRPPIPFLVRPARAARSANVPGAPWAAEKLGSVTPALDLDETVMLDAARPRASEQLPPMVAEADQIAPTLEEPELQFEEESPATIEDAQPAPDAPEPTTGPGAEWLRALEHAIENANLSDELKKQALAIAKNTKPPV